MSVVVIKPAKVWRKIGKKSKQVDTLPVGTVVTGHPRDNKYFDLYTPVAGYTKTQWLKVGAVVVPPPVTPPPVKTYNGWRCLHPSEGGQPTPANEPNVRRAENAPAVIFTLGLQILAFRVMQIVNPTMTDKNCYAVFTGARAFCNRHGIDSDDPRLMDGIICAGAYFPNTVQVVGNYLTTIPGVHAIDANQPLPSAQTVIDNGWYFIANTGQGPQGAYNFPQGNLGPVAVIYVLREAVRYPVTGTE